MLTENYRKGTMEKLGLGYETLKGKSRAHLLLDLGLRAQRALRRQGRLRSHRPGNVGPHVGHRRARPRAGEVRRPGVRHQRRVLGALGVVSAYVAPPEAGEGQLVDTSLFEAGIQQMYWQAAIYFATGEPPGPTGSAHILSAPYQAFRAADGWLTIGGANQANWERLVRVLNAPELPQDARFASNAERMKNLEALTESLSSKLRVGKRTSLIKALEAAGVPCGPINSIADVAADPQALAREMVVELEHPRAAERARSDCRSSFPARRER